ncbi:MAG TPA: sugar transferase [Candidatus Binatia bacterium]|nr:sugar transferase [Candidatus Binatia bacterium]
MIRRHTTTLRLALMAADAASAVALFVVVSIIRFGVERWSSAWTDVGVDPIPLAAGFAATWTTILWVLGLYRLRARWSWRSDVLDVARATILLALFTFTALFWFKLPNVSRLFLILLLGAQGGVTLASRLALRAFFRWIRGRGYNARFVLVVGTGPEAERFANRVEARRELGLRVIGHVAVAASSVAAAVSAGARSAAAAGASLAPAPPSSSARLGAGPGGVSDSSDDPPPELALADPGLAPAAVSRPILGDLETIEQILHEHVVDEVAICLPPAAWPIVEPVTRLCEEVGKIVRIPLDRVNLSLPGARLEDFEGTPILSFVYGPDRAVALVLKRMLDVVLAAVALVVLSPLLLAVAAVIRLREGPPILFRQVRVGLHGRPFVLYKFRTMVPDAEARLAELLDLNEIDGQAFKLSNDPRLTPTGRILRRASLDELPQFWNVLRGEMSIVGPRPPLPREVAAYDLWHRRRLSMKPGITGLWQVSARREEDFDRWVELDLAYIDRWSLWLDFKIMARTIPAMLQGR